MKQFIKNEKKTNILLSTSSVVTLKYLILYVNTLKLESEFLKTQHVFHFIEITVFHLIKMYILTLQLTP